MLSPPPPPPPTPTSPHPTPPQAARAAAAEGGDGVNGNGVELRPGTSPWLTHRGPSLFAASVKHVEGGLRPTPSLSELHGALLDHPASVAAHMAAPGTAGGEGVGGSAGGLGASLGSTFTTAATLDRQRQRALARGTVSTGLAWRGVLSEDAGADCGFVVGGGEEGDGAGYEGGAAGPIGVSMVEVCAPGPHVHVQVVSDANTKPNVDFGAAITPNGVLPPLLMSSPVVAASASFGASWGGSSTSPVAADTPQAMVACPVGGSASLTLRVANVGTTVLYFELRGAPASPHRPTRVATAGGVDPGGSFSCGPGRTGKLLPGGVADVTLHFSATAPGVYRELWSLRTSPALVGGTVPTFAVKGVAGGTDDAAPKRQRLETRLRDATLYSMMREVVLALVDAAPLEVAAEAEDAVRRRQRADFERANPGLHYHPAVYDELVVRGWRGGGGGWRATAVRFRPCWCSLPRSPRVVRPTVASLAAHRAGDGCLARRASCIPSQPPPSPPPTPACGLAGTRRAFTRRRATRCAACATTACACRCCRRPKRRTRACSAWAAGAPP
jgi:hypothetical protein